LEHDGGSGMRERKRGLAILAAFCAAVCLTSCTNAGIPVREEKSYALPDAQTNYSAPIGDASLDYSVPAVFYLPRHDGNRLISVTEPITLSEGRMTAESIVRLLLEQSGSAIASPLGGDVKLSLYGANPVEVSGDVATVNLSASALQLDRKTLFLVGSAITNTLTELPNIQYVNLLVTDKKLALDLGATLPVGALTRSMGEDLGALYEQELSRRVLAVESAKDKRLTATVTLYFPLAAINGIMAEARNITFRSMDPSDMTVTLLREIGSGAAAVKGSPAIAQLAEYLTEAPEVSQSSSVGGSLITLKFNSQMDDALQAAGVSRASMMAAVCYTLTTFLPSVAGIEAYVDGELVEHVMLGSISGILFDNGIQRRADYAQLLMDNCTLYFADETGQKLTAVQRPIPFYQTANPRALLDELFQGPLAADSVQNAQATIPAGMLKDSDIVGISLSGDTLLVNFSSAFLAVGDGITAQQDRLLAYSLVNTLLHAANARRVAFFAGGSPIEGFTDEIFWKGWFLENPGIVAD
jgi:hypothetical protein